MNGCGSNLQQVIAHNKMVSLKEKKYYNCGDNNNDDWKKFAEIILGISSACNGLRSQ